MAVCGSVSRWTSLQPGRLFSSFFSPLTLLSVTDWFSWFAKGVWGWAVLLPLTRFCHEFSNPGHIPSWAHISVFLESKHGRGCVIANCGAPSPSLGTLEASLLSQAGVALLSSSALSASVSCVFVRVPLCSALCMCTPRANENFHTGQPG